MKKMKKIKKMNKTTSSPKPLTGRVALVAGATRGAGRGIARALSEAGAMVYCTGRSVKGKPSPYGRPETIDETAAMITAAGGKAIAIRVDHTNEAEVKALFRRILRAHKRVDVSILHCQIGADHEWAIRAVNAAKRKMDVEAEHE